MNLSFHFLRAKLLWGFLLLLFVCLFALFCFSGIKKEREGEESPDVCGSEGQWDITNFLAC